VSHRSQLIQVQRRILGAIRRDIRETLGKQPRDLERYERVYHEQIERPFRATTRETLLTTCEQADIVFVGDYHTLAAAQQFALRLLRTLWERGSRDWTLALEMLQVCDRGSVERYLARELDDEEFLREIEYDKTWGFRWPHFRPFFETARELKIPVIGINCDLQVRRASLVERDICAAMAVAQTAAANPGMKMLVVDGDMHVAKPHLPAMVDDLLRKLEAKRRWVVIHQNVESVHWRLVEQGRERKVEVVRFSPRELCVQHTHPLVKLQSYLNWLEYEEMLAPVLGETWSGDGEREINLQGQVGRFIESIAKTLGIRDDLSDFTVYTVGDLNFLDDLSDVHVYTNEEIGLVAIQILKGESHFLPEGNLIYLANLTVNHAAEEAAHFINFQISGPPPQVKSRRHDFYHRTMREVLGFFGSKIINPSRLAYRAEDYRDVERELRGKRLDVKGRDLRKIARAVIAHLEIEEEVLANPGHAPRRLPKRCWDEFSVFIGVIHALGYRLGLLLYNGLEQGAISREEIRDLFRMPFAEEGSAREAYFDLLGRLREVRVPYERQRERL
jgi:heme-binding uptake protein ChaN (Tiki superfamily)